MRYLFQGKLKYSQFLRSEPDNYHAPIDSAITTFRSKNKLNYAASGVLDVRSLVLTLGKCKESLSNLDTMAALGTDKNDRYREESVKAGRDECNTKTLILA